MLQPGWTLYMLSLVKKESHRRPPVILYGSMYIKMPRKGDSTEPERAGGMFPLLSSLQVKHFSLNQQSQSHDILDSICLCISLLITFERRCSCEKFGGIVWISVYYIFRVLSCSHLTC